MQTGIGYSLKEIDLTGDPKQVYDIINNENGLPDWVLCDLDLNIEGAGKEVAKLISSELFPTDVLLYTYAGLINHPDLLPEKRYGATLMANRDEIDGRISWLMWKTLVKLSDPEYIRGLLLSRATDTESLLDEYLSYIFRIREEKAESFRWELLRGEGYNWNHKYKVLESELSKDIKSKLSEKEIKMDKIYGHLSGIFTFRNDIVHGILRADKEGGLYNRNRSSSLSHLDSSQDCKTRKDIKKQL